MTLFSNVQLKRLQTSVFLNKLIGALAFDKNTGFWIISSIPRFPAKADGGYIFADQQLPYGQIALCVTVLQSEKNQIGNGNFMNMKKPFFL